MAGKAKKNGTSGFGSGTPFGQQMEASKKWKAPKDYKPLSGADRALIASTFIPGGVVAKVASKAGKAVAKLAEGKYAEKAGAEVTKKYTQMRNAKIEVTPPKKTGVGKNSPVEKTKVDVTTTKRSQSPKQQASQNEGRVVRETIKKTAKTGKTVAASYEVGKASEIGIAHV